jgi:hypothetical protein
VLVLLIEIPSNINTTNLWIALAVTIIVAILLFTYLVFSTKRSKPQIPKTEERRLKTEFPTVFAFVDSIGDIRSERDFDQFVGKLDHLLEVEKRARGVNDAKDIETMKAIAYARLVSKKR